jgi:hypothetical protein
MGPSTWLQFLAVAFGFLHLYMLVAFHHLLPSEGTGIISMKIEPSKHESTPHSSSQVVSLAQKDETMKKGEGSAEEQKEE